ncbi:hypothetical protein WA158_005135 [Blastocystis sp. Blastoise]
MNENTPNSQVDQKKSNGLELETPQSVKRISEDNRSKTQADKNQKTTFRKWKDQICDAIQVDKIREELEIIEFKDCKIDESGAESLQNLLFHGVPKLRKIKLQNNNLGDKGVQLISRGIRKSPIRYDSLVLLNVADNNITSEGLMKIVKLIQFTNGTLNVIVDHNPIGYIGINSLYSCKYWEEIHLVNVFPPKSVQTPLAISKEAPQAGGDSIASILKKGFDIPPYKLLFVKSITFKGNGFEDIDIGYFFELIHFLPVGSLQVFRVIDEYISDLGFYFFRTIEKSNFLATLKFIVIKNTLCSLDGIKQMIRCFSKGFGSLIRLYYEGLIKVNPDLLRARHTTPSSASSSSLSPFNVTIDGIELESLLRGCFEMAPTTRTYYIRIESGVPSVYVPVDNFLLLFNEFKLPYLSYLIFNHITVSKNFIQSLFSLLLQLRQLVFVSIQNIKKIDSNYSLKLQPNLPDDASMNNHCDPIDLAVASDGNNSNLHVSNHSPANIENRSPDNKSKKNKQIEEDIHPFTFAEKLVLNNCELDDDDIIYLCSVIFNTKTLEYVSLDNNKITDVGFDYLYSQYMRTITIIEKKPYTISIEDTVISPTEEVRKIPVISLEGNLFNRDQNDRGDKEQEMKSTVEFEVQELKSKKCFCF